MSVSTLVPLPGKGLTEAMDSTASRHSHIFVIAIAVLLSLASFLSDIVDTVPTNDKHRLLNSVTLTLLLASIEHKGPST